MSTILSEIWFYGDLQAEPYSMISQRTSVDIPHQMKIYEFGYPHSNALLQSHFKLELCKSLKAAHHSMECDVINVVKLFVTVCRRIYCLKFLI